MNACIDSILLPIQSTVGKLIIILALISLITIENGCSRIPNSEMSATYTAQSKRAEEQATQIGLSLRATDIKGTATALTQLERTQQAVYDTTATDKAKTQQATATAAARAAQATITAQAWGQFIQTARNWPPVLVDNFDDNAGSWPIGAKADRLAAVTWSLVTGKYHWKAKAEDGFIWWEIPEMDEVGDFYLSVDLLPIQGPPKSEQGLVLRYTSQGSFYALIFDARGRFSFHLYENQSWESVLPWIESSAVNAGGINQVEIIAQGPTFSVIINGDYLYSISYNHIYRGKIGLLIGLANAGDEAHWEFDNFELRTPLKSDRP